MLKKPASFVLASLRGSTYRSVRLASSLAAALLAAFLSILFGTLLLFRAFKSVRYWSLQSFAFTQPAKNRHPLHK